MMLHDAIRNTRTEHAIYFLLTAYLDTLQFSRKLPDHLTVMPILNMQDMQDRFEKLVSEFETELRIPDSHKFFVLLEAVGIFDLAAVQLCQLKNEADAQHNASLRPAAPGTATDIYAV